MSRLRVDPSLVDDHPTFEKIPRKVRMTGGNATRSRAAKAAAKARRRERARKARQ